MTEGERNVELGVEWLAMVGACGVVGARRGGLWVVVDRWLERRWIERVVRSGRRRRRAVADLVRVLPRDGCRARV